MQSDLSSQEGAGSGVKFIFAQLQGGITEWPIHLPIHLSTRKTKVLQNAAVPHNNIANYVLSEV